MKLIKLTSDTHSKICSSILQLLSIRSNGNVLSLEFTITDDSEYSVVMGFCDNDYSSFSYSRVDHIFSLAGELPDGYFLLLITLPLFALLYVCYYVYWTKSLQSEKKKTYYTLFSILCILLFIEYLILSIFIFYYQFTGNYYSIILSIFAITVILLRGSELCCYLYLTMG